MATQQSPSDYAKAVITTEGVVQQYIAYIAGIDEKTLWPEGITPMHPAAEFQTRTGSYRLRVEMVDRDYNLDDSPVRSPVFRTELARLITDVVRMFKVHSADIAGLETARLVIDRNTTLVAYAPGPRVEEIRDKPRRIGFVLEATPKT